MNRALNTHAWRALCHGLVNKARVGHGMPHRVLSAAIQTALAALPDAWRHEAQALARHEFGYLTPQEIEAEILEDTALGYTDDDGFSAAIAVFEASVAASLTESDLHDAVCILAQAIGIESARHVALDFGLVLARHPS